MTFLGSKTGISVVALVGLFVFGALMLSGVFGNTQIALTLFSNPDLEDGLVGHWSFDGDDLDLDATSNQVLDRSGSANHGTLSNFWTHKDIINAPNASTSIIRPSCASGEILPCYASISAWESAHQADITESGQDVIAIARIEGDWTNATDTALVTINGWTTDADNFIYIYTTDEARHNGAWDYDKYVLNPNDSTALALYDNHVRIDGLQIEADTGTGADRNAIEMGFISAGAEFYISNNIIRHGSGSGARINGIKLEGSGTNGTLYAYNNIVYDFDNSNSTCIGSDSPQSYFFNNTVSGCDIGFQDQQGNTSVAVNNISRDNSNDFSDSGFAYVDSNASDDGDGTNSISPTSAQWDSIFVSTTTPDFRLQDYTGTNSIIDQGVDLTGTTTFAFHSDIQNQLRGDSWDIGADEYEGSTDFVGGGATRGKIGGGFEFDGVDDYITVANQVGGDMTLAMWIKVDGQFPSASNGYQGAQLLYSDVAGSANDFILAGTRTASLDRITFFSGNPDTNVHGSTDVADGSWHHVVAVREQSSGNVRIYIDGELDVSGTSNTNSLNANSNIVIGTNTADDQFYSGVYFDGRMDDVRVYNRVLATTSIQRLYQLGATTKIAQTLSTNPDLEEGLVGHWTFDSTDVSGFTVSDGSGNGYDGYIVATSSQSEVAVDTSVNTNQDTSDGPMPTTVWTSDQDGLLFYPDQSATIYVASTTDGGATWSDGIAVDTVNSGDAFKVAVWYDKWTPDNDGTDIHVATWESGNDEIYYVRYDTITHTFTTAVEATSGSASLTSTNSIAITRAEDGTIYVMGEDAGATDTLFASCSTNCASAASWTDRSNPIGHSASAISLVPIKGTDNILMAYLSSGSDLLASSVYSATSSSWWYTAQSFATGLESDNVGDDNAFSMSYDIRTGTAYVVVTDDTNDYSTEDHDLDFWQYDISTHTWSQLTSPITNASGGLGRVSLAIDQNRGTLYVVYDRRTTIGTDTTANIYYRFSEDGGNTWSTEIGPYDSAATELMADMQANFMSDERITVSYAYDTSNDKYVVTLADIGDYEDEKTTLGKIGQGMQFDGSDDGVLLEDPALDNISTFTYAAWIYPESFGEGGEGDVLVKWCCKEIRMLNGGGEQSIRAYVNAESVPASANAANNSITLNEWQHIAVTFASTTGSTPQIWRNGQLLALASSVASAGAVSVDSSDDFAIGRPADPLDSTSRAFDGKIDDVRIYNRVLATSSIQRLYELGATTKIAETNKNNPDLNNGLVAYYTFDGADVDLSATEEILDSTSNSHDGDMQNFTSNADGFGPGKIGQAGNFDGTNDGIDIDDNADFTLASAMSVGMWIKPDDAPTTGEWYILAKKRRSDSNSWQLNMYNDGGTHELSGSIDTGSTSYGFFSSSTIPMREWTHVVMTWDGSDIRRYINGVQDGGETGTAGSMSDTSHSVILGWGTSVSGGSFEPYDGLMDDVRIYNRAISAEEVERLYQMGN